MLISASTLFWIAVGALILGLSLRKPREKIVSFCSTVYSWIKDKWSTWRKI